jgi:hypothetical protein
MEKGTSIVSTQEYMELLKFKKAMTNEFVEFEYCIHRRRYAYSKDGFLKKHKEELERMKKSLEDKQGKIETLRGENNELKFKVCDLEGILKVSEKSTPKFGWESFIRGAIFGICISAFILSIIYSLIK